MRRHTRLAMRGRRNASDEVFPILDVQISGFVLLVGQDLPSEQAGIEITRALRVWCTQIGPAERAGDVRDSDPSILCGLPHAEMRTGGILNHGHTSQVHDVKGRHHRGASELLDLGSGLIGAIHRDVNHPVRRHTLSALICAECVSSGCVTTVQFENCVELAWPDGIVLRAPAKEGAVEILGCVLIGGSKFNPAERSSGVLIDVGHSGTSLPQLRRGNCQRDIKL